MNRRTFLLQTLAALSTALPTSAAVTPAPPEFAEVRRFIQQGILQERAPSVAVAVVKHDKLIWAEGFGFADLEAHRPATAESIYLLASVSKPITATGLMVLADRGLIELDKPANAYLPGSKLQAARGSAEEITVRRLANHTSGLQVHYNFYYDNVPPLSHDEVIRRYGIAHTLPGSRIEYCNLAFGILDYITEVVAQAPWRKFMEESVYDPIGMSHTSDRVRPELEPKATVQYQPDLAGKFIREPPYQFDHNGASAIWSSATDLSRFLRLHLNKGAVDGRRLLKEETARSMTVVSAIRNPENSNAGFGVAWAVGSTLGHRTFEHSGGMPGVATWIRGFPDDHAGFVVLINASGTDLMAKTCEGLTRALFPNAREELARPAPKRPVDTKPDRFVGEWKGALSHFEGDISMTLSVSPDGTARAKLGKREAIPLRDVSFANSTMKGQMRGQLTAQPGYHGPVTLEYALEVIEEEIIGIGVAKAEGYFALSHGVRLARQRGKSEGEREAR